MAQGKLIRVLANAQSVVRVLAEEGTMSPAELAEATGIPRPTVYRLAEGLAAVNLVEFRDDSSVTLSRRWLSLSETASHSLSEWSHASPILTDLQEQTQQTVYLSVPRKNVAQHPASVCIDWRPGSALNVMLLKPGYSLPLHAGASGKAILAFGQVDLTDYAAHGLTSFTERTLTTVSELSVEAEETRRRGYSISDEDVTTGIGALGAPVLSARLRLIGAVSIAGHADEFRDRREELAAAVVAAAAELSG